MLDTKNIEIKDNVLDLTGLEGELDKQIIIMEYGKCYEHGMSLEATRGIEAKESAHTFQLKNCK